MSGGGQGNPYPSSEFTHSGELVAEGHLQAANTSLVSICVFCRCAMAVELLNP